MRTCRLHNRMLINVVMSSVKAQSNISLSEWIFGGALNEKTACTECVQK